MVNAFNRGLLVAIENEASVEEILESIKKVIARDSRETAGDARKRKADIDAAVEQVAAELPQATLETEADEAETADEVLDLTEMELSEVIDMDEEGEKPLITEEVRGAMQDNLAALAMLAEPGAKPQIVRSGETSLEGLTRELLRPMLAEWLDQNLPGMVEKMVQAEIARIAGKKD